MRKLLPFVVALVLVPSLARAQSLTATSIYLGATGCALKTGAGAPTGGTSCDFYFDTATGHVWTNHAGTWIDISTRTPTFQAVTSTGAVTAASVAATGAVTAATVSATTKITTPLIDAAANLQLAPTGDLLLAPAGRDVMPGTGYTVNLGAITNKYLTLHAAELWVETLVAQQTMATIGGRVVVAPTNILTRDVAAGDTTIFVKYNSFQLHVPTVELGSKLFLESAGKFEAMTVLDTAAPAAQPDGSFGYAVQRDGDGSGANVWSAGDAVLDTGKVGSGFIDLYSLRGVLTATGPTMVGNVRTGGLFNDLAPRFAVGNLNGLYGHSGDQYGFAAGNALGAYIYIDDTNGLVMNGPAGNGVQITPSGNASFAGSITANSGSIAGWTIDANQLSKQTGGLYSGMHSGAGSNVRFYAGGSPTNVETAPFRVYADGSVVMSSAVITAPNAGAGGASLNADPDTRDVNLWANCAGACYTPNIGDGVAGAYSLRSFTGVAAVPVETRRIPYDRAKQYRVHFWARSGGGANGALYAGVSAYDATGTECDTVNCPTGGTRWLYCAVNVAAASITNWTEYNCLFGAGTNYPVAAAMRTMAPQALMNIAGGTAGWFELQDFRIEEVAPSTLIKDGAITTAKVQAGAITAGQLNATGFGDNVIKNGGFEPNTGEQIGGVGAVSALAGWELVLDSTTFSPLLGNQCCGLLGPGTLYLKNTGSGNYQGATYLAVPIENSSGTSPGVKYRLSFRVHPAGVPGPHLYVIIAEYNGTQGGVRRVTRSAAAIGSPGGIVYPDVNRTSEQILGACLPLTAEWNTFEFTYTPTAGTVMASIILYNTSGVCGGTPTDMHFDDIEMQKQIGTGHISANSITANLIQAGAITADKIAAGAITAGSIAAGSITGDKIAASTITGTNIAADSITGAHIVAGTITASDIASGTITADRLNVTALSAITANLGSVTAGNLSAVAISGGTIDGTTIRGVTITASSTITGGSISGGSITGVSITGSSISAGSGYVTIDANGISVSNGAASAFGRIKLGGVELWGDGTALITGSGFNAPGLFISGDAHITNAMRADGDIFGRHVNATGNYYLASGNSLYWSSGSPSAATGFTLVMANCGGAYCVAYQSSSQRDKENVRPWAPADPLALLALPLYRYDRKDEPGVSIGARDHVGFMVEDLVQFAPDAVGRDLQGRPASFYSDTLDTYLLAALKAVNARVGRTEALESRVQELERQVAALVARKGGHE